MFSKETCADDCIVNQINQQKYYLIITCDKQLKSRLKKFLGNSNNDYKES